MAKLPEVEVTRYGALPKWLQVIFLVLTGVGIVLAYGYIFMVSYHGRCLINIEYYCLFMAVFVPCAFLILPARKKDKKTIPWYDFLFAIVSFGIFIYFYTKGYLLATSGWKCIPLGIVLAPLILEGGRRMAGPFYLAVCIILGAYPLYAGYMPGIFWGLSYPFMQMMEIHIFKPLGLIGLPVKIVADILIGFLIFAGVLIASGAGDFFLNLANGLLGRFRGGAAKVSVLSSGFFGSLSGSVFSNIVATGSVTIPTMKRTGYPPHYAGAIEACASTGGVLMPPVMGAVAFVMCEMIGVEYGVVIMAAAIPSLLYYFGLLMQVDAYAGRVGLKGLPREEIPSLKKTLKEGWHFIFVFIFLVWGLIYMRWSYIAPWYAAGLMFLLSFVRKETMMTPRRIVSALLIMGRLITQATAVILPIAFIIAGLMTTGVTASFTSGIVAIGKENIFLILIMGVIACYIMGMAGMSIVAYIILAVTLAPAVIKVAGLNVLAVHLFIIYYAMLDVITLPVAGGAFLAGAMAGASPMRTALQSMRLAIVIYFIPFFFVFNPALILEGSPLEALYLFVLCLVGIVFIAAGCEGYLVKMGRVEFWARPLLLISGLLIGFPEWTTTIIGVVLAFFIIAIMWTRKKRLMPEKG